MKLLDNFYTLKNLSFETNQLKALVKINPNHAIFEGHFPNNPITPGVVQLEMIKELIAIHFERKVSLKKISNCKFLAILDPRKISNLDVCIPIYFSEEGQCQTKATISYEGVTYLKLSAVYELDGL